VSYRGVHGSWFWRGGAERVNQGLGARNLPEADPLGYAPGAARGAANADSASATAPAVT
jgi:hypothetical protein